MHFSFVPVENHPLISSIWQMTISSENTPYTTPLLSTGETFISYNFTKKPNKFTNAESVFELKGLMISGQVYGAITAHYKKKSYDLGIIFKPSAFYKIFSVEMNSLTNTIIPLKKFNKDIFEKLEPIFLEHKYDMFKFKQEVLKFFENISYKTDEKLDEIDRLVNLIFEKDGLLSVDDLLKETTISKKTLENRFKKIIGLTPGKYIRQYRFISLLRKYQNTNINVKDMIKEFKYYDMSHFNKDLKLFTTQTPKEFFGSNYPIVNSLLSQ